MTEKDVWKWILDQLSDQELANLGKVLDFWEGASLFAGQVSPVQEVWAIYPNRYSSQYVDDFPDHKMCLIELTPGYDNSHLARKVSNAIDKLLLSSEPVMRFLGRP